MVSMRISRHNLNLERRKHGSGCVPPTAALPSYEAAEALAGLSALAAFPNLDLLDRRFLYRLRAELFAAGADA